MVKIIANLGLAGQIFLLASKMFTISPYRPQIRENSRNESPGRKRILYFKKT